MLCVSPLVLQMLTLHNSIAAISHYSSGALGDWLVSSVLQRSLSHFNLWNIRNEITKYPD